MGLFFQFYGYLIDKIGVKWFGFVWLVEHGFHRWIPGGEPWSGHAKRNSSLEHYVLPRGDGEGWIPGRVRARFLRHGETHRHEVEKKQGLNSEGEVCLDKADAIIDGFVCLRPRPKSVLGAG